MTQLKAAIENAILWFEERNIPIDDDLLTGYKALERDRREPGRRRKAEFERKLSALMKRIFRRQAGQIEQRLQTVVKAKPPDYTDWFDIDPEDESDLVMLFTLAAQDGVNLFGDQIGIGFDPTLTNAEAAKWARKYTVNFIEGITRTTGQKLAEVIAMFIETPGMTIGDVMKLLPFDEERALTGATTEVTRAYAEANQISGLEMAKEYPDLEITKTWFTNNDDLVCPICGPLNGKEIPVEMAWNADGDPTSAADGIYTPPAHPRCRCWTDYGTRTGR